MPPQHDLYKELQGHNDFFDQLVDMIPAKIYVAGQSGTFLLFKIHSFAINSIVN